MSYEIIPNWTYLGKPVYTNTSSSNSILDIPVAVPVTARASESSYPRFNRRGELESSYPKSSESNINKSTSDIPVATAYPARATTNYDFDIPRKKQELIPLENSLHFKKLYSGRETDPSPKEMEKIIKTKTIYRQTYNRGYQILGTYVRHVTTGDGQNIYYFSKEPEKGYSKLDLSYDPTESDESSNKKAGKRKTSKNNKVKKNRKTRKGKK